MPDYIKIGARIRLARRKHGFSQEQLAEAAGISVTHMSHIETGGTTLSLPVLLAIAAALGVRTDDLLFDRCERDDENLYADILSSLNSFDNRQLHLISELLDTVQNNLHKNA